MIFNFESNPQQIIRGQRLALVSAMSELADYETGYGGWPTRLLNWHAQAKKAGLDQCVRVLLQQGLEVDMGMLIQKFNIDRPDPTIPADMMETWVATAGRFLDEALFYFGKDADDTGFVVITASDQYEQGEIEDNVNPHALSEDALSYVEDATGFRGARLAWNDAGANSKQLTGPLWPRWDLLPVISLSIKPTLVDLAEGLTDKPCELLLRNLLISVPWKKYPQGIPSEDLMRNGAVYYLGKIFGTDFDSRARSTEDPLQFIDIDRTPYWWVGSEGGKAHWADPDDHVPRVMETIASIVQAALGQDSAPSWLNLKGSDSNLMRQETFWCDHRQTTPTSEWVSAGWRKKDLPYAWYLPWCVASGGIVGFIDAVSTLYAAYRHLALQTSALEVEESRVQKLISSGAVEGDDDVNYKPKPKPVPAKKTNLLPLLLGGAALLGTAAVVASNQSKQDEETADSSKE